MRAGFLQKNKNKNKNKKLLTRNNSFKSSEFIPKGLDELKLNKLFYALSEIFSSFNNTNLCMCFGKSTDLPTAFFIKGSSVTGLKFSSEKQDANNGKGVFNDGSDYDCGLVWPAGCAFFDFLANGGNDNLDPKISKTIQKMSIGSGGKTRVNTDGDPALGYSLHLSENWRTFFPNGFFHDDIFKLIESFCNLGHEINFIIVKDKANIPAEAELVEKGSCINLEILNDAEARHKKRQDELQTRVDYQKRSLFSNDPDKLAQEMANVFIITWDRLRAIAENYEQENDGSEFTPFFDTLSNLPKADLSNSRLHNSNLTC